jgi:CRP/FNR family cyclic AMP-dependent transcriptional regulator
VVRPRRAQEEKLNVQQLMDAVAELQAHDALPCKLTLDEWKKLAPYLAIRFLKAGDTLIREGESDRELFILAEGELHVTIHSTVLARLAPGTVVGEGTFFSGQPRSATVVSAEVDQRKQRQAAFDQTF